MQNQSKSNKHSVILEAATEQLSLKPTSTLQEIADYAKIGIATLHRYFSSKEALLEEIAFHALELVESSMEEITFYENDINRSFMELFQKLIPLGDKIYFLAYAASVDENPEVAFREAALKKVLMDSIRGWKKQGLLKDSLPEKWMLTTIYNLLFVAWQEIHSGNMAKNDAAGILTDTILNGFLNVNKKGDSYGH
jgi:AcrR family transcriptional regulator